MNDSGTVSCWTSSEDFGLTIYTTSNGGSTWSTQTNPSGARSFSSIDCLTDSGSDYCWAAGGDGSYPDPGALYEMSSGSWSTQTVPGRWLSITGMSCISISDCTASGLADAWIPLASPGPGSGAMMTWDGSSWTSDITVSGSTVSNTVPGSMEDYGATALSCTSSDYCYASGPEGIIGTQDGGASWSQRLFTPPRGEFGRVACLSHISDLLLVRRRRCCV